MPELKEPKKKLDDTRSPLPASSLPLPDLQKSGTFTANMPLLNTSIQDLPQSLSHEYPTQSQNHNTGTSASSAPENEDILTAAQEKVRIKLSGLYTLCGTLIAGVRPYAGMVIMKSAHIRSEEVVRACRHNKEAWNILLSLVSGGDIIGCIAGHGLMIWAILLQAQGRDTDILEAFGYSEKQILGDIMGIFDGSESSTGNSRQ